MYTTHDSLLYTSWLCMTFDTDSWRFSLWIVRTPSVNGRVCALALFAGWNCAFGQVAWMWKFCGSLGMAQQKVVVPNERSEEESLRLFHQPNFIAGTEVPANHDPKRGASGIPLLPGSL